MSHSRMLSLLRELYRALYCLKEDDSHRLGIRMLPLKIKIGVHRGSSSGLILATLGVWVEAGSLTQRDKAVDDKERSVSVIRQVSSWRFHAHNGRESRVVMQNLSVL